MRPVPQAGSTGMPQTSTTSIANAIMSNTFGDEIEAHNEPLDFEDDNDEPTLSDDVADWEEWNTPRYDVQRFYQSESTNLDPDTTLDGSREYLSSMNEADERLLRAFIRSCLREVNAVSTGGGSGVQTGNIRGVVTPLGTGPTHPKKSDKKGAKKRTDKRLRIAADNFGGGDYVNEAIDDVRYALDLYTSTGHRELKRAEEEGDDPDFTHDVEALNRFLQQAPKHKGIIFRGRKARSKEDYERYTTPGSTVEFDSITSWSKSRAEAVDFAVGDDDPSLAMVLKANGNKVGAVDISEYSTWEHEDELLVPKGRFEVLAVLKHMNPVEVLLKRI